MAFHVAAMGVILAVRVGFLSAIVVRAFSVTSVATVLVGIISLMPTEVLWAPANVLVSTVSNGFDLQVLVIVGPVVIALLEFIELIEEGS